MIVITYIAVEREAELPVGREAGAMDQLGFERVKEGLHVGVVARRAHAGGTLANAQGAEAIPEGVRGILTAANAVKDRAGASSSASSAC